MDLSNENGNKLDAYNERRNLQNKQFEIDMHNSIQRHNKSHHISHQKDNFHNNKNSDTYSTKEKTKVVVFIPTPVEFADRRVSVNKQFERENWNRNEVIIIWVFGTKTGPKLEFDLNVSSVYQEKFMNKNNVLLTNCRDNDVNNDYLDNANGTSATTCKVYEAMKYIYYHYEAEYVWRGADDAYLNLRKFFLEMPNLPKERLWLGRLKFGDGVFNDLKIKGKMHNLHRLFGMDKFPSNYMLGMGSVFSWDVIKFIATWTIPPHQTWCEDIMIGMWLNPFQIHKVDRPDMLFNLHTGESEGNGKGNFNVFLVHYMKEDDWKNIHDDGSITITCPLRGQKTC
eukprot:gene8662-11705_t